MLTDMEVTKKSLYVWSSPERTLQC